MIAKEGQVRRTLAGLPTFCPIVFHLLASYSLMAESKATLLIAGLSAQSGKGHRGLANLVFCEIGVVHVLPNENQWLVS